MLRRRLRARPARGAWFLCAGLLVGCAGPPLPADRPSEPVQALAPKGTTDWPPTFTWSGVPADGVVRVRVFDEAERQVFGMEARGASKGAPDELRKVLTPGTTYLWRVARVDANGEETGASALTPFSIR